MGDVAVSVQGLWKEYRIGTAHRATSLRDELGRLLRHPFAGAAGDKIWAIRDLSFDVAPGEVVGICGRNGAGKSTLLKILSRVTEPTRGRVVLRGRVSSLLEVGTGFHGDLSGRENVFLNGALLGMRQGEVQRRLDEIVAFAGIGKFLDTPVRHYSSGMQARLGFAVAAHLEQDILILDEVLAVGDVEFQRKCLDTVHEISRGGKTVLLVSHNMFAVERFCSRAVLLDQGQVRDIGPPRRIIDRYLAETEIGVEDRAAADDEIVVRKVSVRSDAGPGRLRGTLAVTMDVDCLKPLEHLTCGLGIYNSAGHLLGNATAEFAALARGPHRLLIDLANPGLPPGDFTLAVAAMRRGRWMKYFRLAASLRIPTTVTDDPHMLDRLDLAGIALQVTRTSVATVDTP